MYWINESVKEENLLDEEFSLISPQDICNVHLCWERNGNATGPCTIKVCVGTVFCWKNH